MRCIQRALGAKGPIFYVYNNRYDLSSGIVKEARSLKLLLDSQMGHIINALREKMRPATKWLVGVLLSSSLGQNAIPLLGYFCGNFWFLLKWQLPVNVTWIYFVYLFLYFKSTKSKLNMLIVFSTIYTHTREREN